jgi:hypothetical protein
MPMYVVPVTYMDSSGKLCFKTPKIKLLGHPFPKFHKDFHEHPDNHRIFSSIRITDIKNSYNGGTDEFINIINKLSKFIENKILDPKVLNVKFSPNNLLRLFEMVQVPIEPVIDEDEAEADRFKCINKINKYVSIKLLYCRESLTEVLKTKIYKNDTLIDIHKLSDLRKYIKKNTSIVLHVCFDSIYVQKNPGLDLTQAYARLVAPRIDIVADV